MKMQSLLKVFVLFTVCFSVMTSSEFLGAQDWPNKPISIVVGWTAGGTTDLITRILAEPISKSLGVPVVVENKPGGSSIIALNYISKAKPDGYTLCHLTGYSVTDRPHLKNVPFDPISGFTYVCQVFNWSYGIVVRPDAPWKTINDFISDVKKEPGKYAVSLAGIGSPMHLCMARLEKQIPGFKVKIVPYKGGVPAVTALLGGHVDLCIQTQEWKPYVDSGQLRLLAIPQRNRMKDYPNVPTLLEAGLGIYLENPSTYVAPPGLPEKIRERLQEEFKKAMEYPGFKDFAKKSSLSVEYRPGKELYSVLMKLYEENKQFIPTLGITLED